MMTLAQAGIATLDDLTNELAAAGWDSSQADTYDARKAVGRCLYVHAGPFDLRDSESNDVIRDATEDETIESVLAGPEGHILVDGRRCYVAD